MQLKIVPARAGLLWIKSGLMLFFARPASFVAFFCSFMLLVLLCSQLPQIGGVLAMLLMPALTLGMMTVGNETVKLRRIQQSNLSVPVMNVPPMALAWLAIRVRFFSLLKMGGLFALGLALILLLSTLVDGGIFAQVYIGNTPATKELVNGEGFQSAFLLSTVLYAPLAALFWFAPALVHWKNFGIGKSMFYSLYATLKNWRAFAVYVLGWGMLFTLAMAVLLTLVLALLGASIANILLLPVALMLTCAFLASTFVTFVDCFMHPELVAATAEVTQTNLSS